MTFSLWHILIAAPFGKLSVVLHPVRFYCATQSIIASNSHQLFKSIFSLRASLRVRPHSFFKASHSDWGHFWSNQSLTLPFSSEATKNRLYVDWVLLHGMFVKSTGSSSMCTQMRPTGNTKALHCTRWPCALQLVLLSMLVRSSPSVAFFLWGEPQLSLARYYSKSNCICSTLSAQFSFDWQLACQ